MAAAESRSKVAVYVRIVDRVTRCVWEKIVQNLAKSFLSKLIIYILPRKKYPKVLGYLIHFRKNCSKNYCPIGENSPNLVTLIVKTTYVLMYLHTWVHTWCFEATFPRRGPWLCRPCTSLLHLMSPNHLAFVQGDQMSLSNMAQGVAPPILFFKL
jgi:hypothetical protein